MNQKEEEHRDASDAVDHPHPHAFTAAVERRQRRHCISLHLGCSCCVHHNVDTMTQSPIESFTAVVPAGGIGSRLWPLSRPERPKFLLDLLGTGTTLLQGTLERLAPLTDDVLVVTGVAHQ